MDHTPANLNELARDLRTGLASIPKNSPALMFAPAPLRAALPKLEALLVCLADVGDATLLVERHNRSIEERLTRCEAMLRELQGLPRALDTWEPTLTTPAAMPSLDYNLDELGEPHIGVKA